ncbi:ATP-binding cassette subfamily B protein [Oceanotoga teriensis]|jgi:ATP-binding cassette subfamily B protein|uniref:ATP-binding cassette subfamily B protein n=1 Tax=Oceanotoga teriensis TaxID=515440 RepID=A0AA45C7D2_9BACT|nr:ABC transporter ATP-binding protein [Oceanotoga teriensis]PWJ95259.1 ATP-binding cassette subfamily B protein [Oceanotoga teriensis]
MFKILKYLKKYKLFTFISILAMLGFTGLDLLNPYITKTLVDKVFVEQQYDIFLKLILILIGIMILKSIFAYTREFLFDYIGTKVMGDIKKDLFSEMQKYDFSFFDNKNTGELMSRIGEDAENIWNALGFGIGFLSEAIITFISATTILFYLNYKLAILSVITMPIIFYLALKMENKISKSYDEISDQAAKINTTAQENISGVRLVKAYANEKKEVLKFLNLNKQNYDLNMKKTRIFGKYYPAIELVGNMTMIIVMIFGGMLTIKEEITIGTLLAFTEYIWLLIWPMRTVGMFMNVISQANSSARKIQKIKDYEPKIVDNKKDLEIKDSKIVFNNVWFKYNDKYILKNINLKIQKGQTLAIIGPTGSGKTSLVNLIARFYEIDKGNIYIDNEDIRNYSLKKLRENISYVFQENFLFSESVEENIKLAGNENDIKLNEILENSGSKEFVEKLKYQEKTIIGERGQGLSGGQKQRLTIARALNKNSKIIVLDDATSALDMETEYEVLKNINKLNKEQIKIIIAHRISAVKNADQIVYLEDGEIKEIGTHMQLINKKGKYYNIYLQQFKDFIEEEIDEVI